MLAMFYQVVKNCSIEDRNVYEHLSRATYMKYAQPISLVFHILEEIRLEVLIQSVDWLILKNDVGTYKANIEKNHAFYTEYVQIL